MTTYFKDLNSASDHTVRRVQVPARQSYYRLYFKRFFDVAFVVAAAPVALPLVLFAALLAMLDGGAPFYRQRRVGQNGRIFDMIKIRTMVPDADRVLAAYLAEYPDAHPEWEKHQKLRNDPRITRVGCFLRKASLDELPQLWNVLVGDMSVVGPRPMMVDQKPLYSGTAYFAMRPGVTGAWQVSDRNESTFAERVGFDDAYYRDISLKTDLNIIARTVGVVIRCTGY